MLDRAEGPRVSIGWLIAELGERSFGLSLLVMAIIALLPGASTIVGLLIAWPAIQLILGHDTAALPRVMARREVEVDRLARVIAVVVPRLAWVERLIRPRWPAVFSTTRRLIGTTMLLVGLTLISPVPFSHVVPALVIMLLALAYLEEDGFALLLALFAALCSLAVTGATVWGAVETIDWIDPATHARAAQRAASVATAAIAVVHQRHEADSQRQGGDDAQRHRDIARARHGAALLGIPAHIEHDDRQDKQADQHAKDQPASPSRLRFGVHDRSTSAWLWCADAYAQIGLTA